MAVPSRPGSWIAPAVLVAVLVGIPVVPGAWAASARGAIEPYGPAPSAPGLGRAWDGWTPASGHASPGAPSVRLVTRPLRSTTGSSGPPGLPVWLAYDGADNAFWVATNPSSVDVFGPSNLYGQSPNAVLPVGVDPFGVAIDNASDTVFVSDAGSDNVTEINGSTDASIGSIPVGASPHGLAFDPVNRELYVADSGDRRVTVYSERRGTVVANVSVGRDPIGVAFDRASGDIFVADSDSNAISVLRAATNRVIATVRAGVAPYGVTVDPSQGTVYVTNQGSDSLTVLRTVGLHVLATIPLDVAGVPFNSVNTTPEGLAYDPPAKQIWVGTGAYFTVVVSTTTKSVVGYLDVDPAGVAWDPVQRIMCMTNSNNQTYACLSTYTGGGYGWTASHITVSETGLPAGTPWNVTLGGDDNPVRSTGSSVTLPVDFAFFTCDYFVPPSYGYSATPSVINTTCGNTGTAAVKFHATPEFPVHVRAVGLPPSTGFGVVFEDEWLASSGGPIRAYAPNGTYPIQVVGPPGFALTSTAPSSMNVTGTAVTVLLRFVRLVELDVRAYGLGPGTRWWLNLTYPSGALAAFGTFGTWRNLTLPAGRYAFTLQSAGAIAHPASGSFVLARGSLALRARFT